MDGIEFTTRRNSLERVLLPSLLLPLWGLLIFATPAQGQVEVIQGSTVDHLTGQTVSDVLIELLNNDLEVAKTTISDSLGNFILITPGPGLYALRGSHADYLGQMSLPVELESGAAARVVLRLSTTTVLLDPMEVVLDTDDDPLARNASIRTSRNGAIDGEIVQGTTVANETGTIVGQVRVQLLSEAEEVLEETVSDDEGRFFIRAPRPGTYVMRGTRLGYEEQRSAPFVLAEGDNTVASFKLSPNAILLDPLTVTVEAQFRGYADGFMKDFYERKQIFQHLGQNEFFEREDLTAWDGMNTAVGLTALSKNLYLETVPGQGQVPYMKQRFGIEYCQPAIYVNGSRSRILETIVSGPDTVPGVPFSAVIGSVDEIEAVEVYRDGILNAPGELTGSMNVGLRAGGGATPDPSVCGVISIWTRRR